MKTEVALESLVGVHWLSGVDRENGGVVAHGEKYQHCDSISFELDGVVYTAVEDPDDGYRSSMERLFVDDRPIENKFKRHKVLGRLNSEIIEFIDAKTGKVVLEVGTDSNDTYYPCWVASWNPENLSANSPKDNKPLFTTDILDHA